MVDPADLDLDMVELDNDPIARLCETVEALRSRMAKCDKLVGVLLAALEDIAKGEGPFNRDPLEHCGNTVDAMKETARAAIVKAQMERGGNGAGTDPQPSPLDTPCGAC